jgi:reverse gyrase
MSKLLSYSSAQLKQEIESAEFNLYLLIWKRAIASQCQSALINKTMELVNSIYPKILKIAIDLRKKPYQFDSNLRKIDNHLVRLLSKSYNFTS